MTAHRHDSARSAASAVAWCESVEVESTDPDFRRLTRWLAVVGAVALLIGLVVVIAMLLFGSHSVAT